MRRKDGDINSKNDSNSSPSSINGKIFQCTAISNEDLTNNYTFSSSSFTAGYQKTWEFTSGTPTYSYKKTGSKTATLNMNYKIRCYISSGINFTDVCSTSLKLTFTSEDGGYLSGTEKIIIYDNITGNSTDSHIFTYESFTLF